MYLDMLKPISTILTKTTITFSPGLNAKNAPTWKSVVVILWKIMLK